MKRLIKIFVTTYRRNAMFSYVPHTPEDIHYMLNQLEIDTISELFEDIPKHLRVEKPLDLPTHKSPMEVERHMRRLSRKNVSVDDMHTFLGGGAYRHYIPAAIDALVSRQEFLTAYTPYQAEMSQGTLRSIFEFQSMICELTGMEVANASHYDGASAMAEAVFMSHHITRKQTILMSDLIHPDTLETVKTYCRFKGLTLRMIPSINGRTDSEALDSLFDETVAAVCLQTPNYHGMIEQIHTIKEYIGNKESKALLIAHIDPFAAALFETVASQGVDIVVGDGQGLGIPLSYGGPYLGFMATRKKWVRQLPGRVVGKTVDKNKETAYVLTLQTREQHIRREKATSNITSNEALMALRATIYLALVGGEFYQIAYQITQKAHYLYQQLQSVKGIKLVHDTGFFQEFLITFEQDNRQVLTLLRQQGIMGGIPVGNHQLLICVSEMTTKEEMDDYAAALEVLI